MNHELPLNATYLFQSLLHQGISLLEILTFLKKQLWSAFQSLLHQGISLLVKLLTLNSTPSRIVSIPSSSGHQFTVRKMTVAKDVQQFSFNPFFIRASVYWFVFLGLFLCPFDTVSIPSSSGHQFTASNNVVYNATFPVVSIPSSSGHQFTVHVLLATGINPGFVSIPSSSGHQFTATRPAATLYFPLPVSIPSSSGHQFTARMQTPPSPKRSGFQSLLHQGISLLSDCRNWLLRQC